MSEKWEKRAIGQSKVLKRESEIKNKEKYT